MHVSWWQALAFGPLVSTACFSVLAIVYGMAGVFCTWATVFVPVLAAAIVAFIASRCASHVRARRIGGCADTGFMGLQVQARTGRVAFGKDALCMVGYVLVGIAVTCGVFLGQLAAPDAFIQSWDNVHHLDAVRAFVDSGRWSSLGTTLYLGQDAEIDPFVEGAFYPSAWHALAAMIASAVGMSAPFAINVANFVIVALAFPIGTYAFLRAVFGSNRAAIMAGALFVGANASCPWMMLTWGPLYPNVMAVCLLPALMTTFVVMLSREAIRRERITAVVVLVVGVAAYVFIQPNGVFSAVVLLAPYLVVRLYEVGKDRHSASRGAMFGMMYAAIAIILVVAFWVAAFNAPFMQAIVQYRWPYDSEIADALMDVVTQRFHIAGLSIGCALMLGVGIVSVFARRRHRWLFFSWLFACAIYVVCVAVDGEWHQILAGFWYTDVPRIASFASFAAVPLQALGLGEIATLVAKPFAVKGKAVSIIPAAVMAALVAIMLYAPIESTESWEVDTRQFTNASTLHVQSVHIGEEYGFDDPRIYDEEERAFVSEVMSIIPEGALVINEPNDGSAYAYGVDGLRTYYRYWRGYGQADEGEKPESALIRGRLFRITSDDQVKAAIESVGAEYVLQLERGERSWNTTMWTYRYGRLWRGIDGIDEDTPGFELVLSRDDMRLYKIIA